MAIVDLMEIGRQGLAANRQALQTTANNIANANTPGYTRRKPVMQANEQSTAGGAFVGGGVEVKQVVRVQDAFVQNQILEESKNFGAARTRSETLHHLESVVSNDSFKVGDLVNSFFNSCRELSVNPESPTMRSSVAQSADTAASGFRHLNQRLSDMKGDLDLKIGIAVDEVNNLTGELAALNMKISQFAKQSDSPHELYDRREAVLRDLSQKLGYEIGTDEQDNANLSAGGLGVLVARGEANKLEVVRTAASGDKGAGSIDVVLRDPFGTRVVTHSLKEGEIGGMLHARDKVINPTLEHLDKVAFAFAQSVNEAHREGYGADGNGDRDLFTQLKSADGASHFIDLNDVVRKNPDAVALSLERGGPSDNRIALKIADLQNSAMMPNVVGNSNGSQNSQTLNESLNALIGNVAVQTRHEDEMFQHQQGIMKQLENYREAISGVSLEEEAMNMIQYQTVFNAAAKAMKVGEELFQTILSIKQ